MRCIYFLIILCLYSQCTSTENRESNSDPQITEIIKGEKGAILDSLLSPYLIALREKTMNDAGLAIGVSQGDQVIYAKAFGFADKSRGIKTDLNTQFHIASLTKPLTAYATLKLSESNRLNLTDSIGKYIPELIDAGSNFAHVNIEQILTHTSGIPRHISVDDWQNSIISEDALDLNIEQLLEHELEFEPGTKYDYSNAAFDILGLVLSRATGQTYFDLMDKEVLQPLGMEHSTFLMPEDTLPINWANSHAFGLKTQVLQPFPYNLKVAPSSSLKASILDMCKWGMLHAGNGVLNNERKINEAIFREMISPQYETPWGDHIGYSWYLQEYLERPIIMHTGESHGFESMLYIYPEEKISICVLANRSESRTGRIINATSEILFGEKPKDYETSAIYSYSRVYENEGRAKANAHWAELKEDTLDSYYTYDYSLLTSGSILENGGQWNQAQDLLKYYLIENKNSTYAWRLLGNCELALADTTEAIRCFQKTLEINPNYEKGKLALKRLEKKMK
ncbi:MAG: serine hydrolase [Bacteroidota bacterium]